MRKTLALVLCAAAAAGGLLVHRGGAASSPTYYKDVAPILDNKCTSCHRLGGIAPFPLTDYDSAKDNATRALDQVDSNAMPPFDAREEACVDGLGECGDRAVRISAYRVGLFGHGPAARRVVGAHRQHLGQVAEPPGDRGERRRVRFLTAVAVAAHCATPDHERRHECSLLI